MQVIDINGNMFGYDHLEIIGIDGKPKNVKPDLGITIGTTSITSGTVGRVLFQGTGNVVQESSQLSWDNTSGILDLSTTSDNIFGLRLRSTTGQLKIKPYLNSSYGVLLESKNAADSAYSPMSLSASKILMLDGNVIINSTSDSGYKLDVNGTARVQGLTALTGTVTASGAIARNQLIDGTLVAAANNDALVGLDINTTYSLGAFTGTSRIGTRIQNSRFLITGTYTSLSSEGINPDSLVQINSTINGRGGSRAIAFRINPIINVNNTQNQVFSALEVTPTFQNIGAGSSTYAINSAGPNTFGTINIFGAQTYFLGQGGTSTYHYVGTIPNGQGFRVRVNNNISGYSYDFDGSGIPTYTLRNNNIDALQVKSTGNVLINTTTDAGYKLDVNGTARVQTGLIASATNPTAQIAGAVSFSSRISGNLNGAISFQSIASLLIDVTGYSGTGSGLVQYAVYAGRSYFNNINIGIASNSYVSSNVINDSTSASLRLIGYNVLTGGSGNNNGTLLLTDRTSGTMLGMTATYGGGGSRLTIFNQYTDGPTSRIKINIGGVDTACFFADGSLQIGNGETTIASAVLSASSTSKGFLPPRMTTTQKNAIATPATGLQVYDTTLNRPCFYDGTTWITL